MNQHFHALHWGRAWAAIAVLIFHAEITLALPKYYGQSWWPAAEYGYAGVHFFFVLSGFIMLAAHRRDFGQPARLSIFAAKRFRRIVPPLWAVLLPLALVYASVPAFGKGVETQWQTILSALLLLPTPSEAILAVEWTLRHEAVFYLVFSACIVSTLLGMSVFGLWFILIIGDILFQWSPIPMVFDPLNLLFFSGMIACALRQRDFKVSLMLRFSAGAVVFLGLWLTWHWQVRLHDPIGVLTLGVPATVGVFWASGLVSQREVPLGSWFNALGDASYAIYLTHFPVVSVLCKLAKTFAVPQALAFCTVVLISLAVGLAFHRWVEVPLMHWWPRRTKDLAA